ncbi:adenylyltransferase/cytidyltransferase family protein [Candidatus Saccharibacteria bacterium]|nr:MAG: adenylyltransferase/cytidyltransferase family protein [Candidatus Saccharibacteria bacterium]
MILKYEDLAKIRAKHRGEKIVLTSGTFDLFHVGHLSYLEQVKQYGDVVVVLLSGDSRVKGRKGSSRPIIPEVDRARILDSLKIVDYVIVDNSELNPNVTDYNHHEILRKLQPDYYVTDGPDPRFVDLMDKSKFIILERTQLDTSTTSIIEQIQAL